MIGQFPGPDGELRADNGSVIITADSAGEASEVFEWYKVDKAVGNSRNQGATLVVEIP